MKKPAIIIIKLETKTIFLGVILVNNTVASLVWRYDDNEIKRFLSYDIIKRDMNSNHRDNIYNAYFKPVLLYMI